MKSIVLKTIIGLVFLILFNVSFFLLGGTEHNLSVWISYGFIHVAYLFLLMTPLLTRADRGEAILSGSIYLRTLSYFFMELIVGLIFIFVHPESITWPVVIQGVMFAFFLVFLLMSLLANDATRASLSKQRKESFYIRSLAESVRSDALTVQDPALRKQLMNCYESLNSCSIESFPQARESELELENTVFTLHTFVEQGDGAQIAQQVTRVNNDLRRRNQAVNNARFA